jgi:hypothetical protein
MGVPFGSCLITDSAEKDRSCFESQHERKFINDFLLDILHNKSFKTGIDIKRGRVALYGGYEVGYGRKDEEPA